jgi:dsDNA-binding SOS-regulon protein
MSNISANQDRFFKMEGLEMKNKLFGKTTALVMGSLIIFSGQAVALSSNNQELTNAQALGESELLIAAASDPLTEEDKEALAIAVAKAKNTLGPAIAATKAAAIPNTAKNAIAFAFSSAQTVLGDAIAQSVAVAQTKGDAAAVAEALSSAKTVVGNAAAQSKAFANSRGGDSLAKAGANAETALGEAVAVAEAIAK